MFLVSAPVRHLGCYGKCVSKTIVITQLLDSYSVVLPVEIKPFNRESKDNNRRVIQ